MRREVLYEAWLESHDDHVEVRGALFPVEAGSRDEELGFVLSYSFLDDEGELVFTAMDGCGARDSKSEECLRRRMTWQKFCLFAKVLLSEEDYHSMVVIYSLRQLLALGQVVEG